MLDVQDPVDLVYRNPVHINFTKSCVISHTYFGLILLLYVSASCSMF